MMGIFSFIKTTVQILCCHQGQKKWAKLMGVESKREYTIQILIELAKNGGGFYDYE